VAALQATYAPSEVVVLRYHQHKPGPDPLANEDSQERFKQYGGTGTPALVVSGRRLPVGGGSLGDAPPMYGMLRTYIDSLLDEKTELRLELSARADHDKVSLSAKAAGLNEFPANARLMPILAEAKIACPMRNGIRFHEMVVRSLPAATTGVAPAKGQLSYAGEVDLAKLKRRLAQQLEATARENQIEFDLVPLNLASLQFVVLLQNSETGEVLQAASVPVAGSDAGRTDAKSARQPEGTKKPASGGN
jgi:hypothetical protein